MNDVPVHAGALLVAAAGAFIGFAVRAIVHLVQQRRAEIALASLLSDDHRFAELLTNFVESLYRFGYVNGDIASQLETYIAQRAADLGRAGKLVREALHQPSVAGRRRYSFKLARAALSRMVEIPISELELGEDPSPRRADAAFPFAGPPSLPA